MSVEDFERSPEPQPVLLPFGDHDSEGEVKEPVMKKIPISASSSRTLFLIFREWWHNWQKKEDSKLSLVQLCHSKMSTSIGAAVHLHASLKV